MTIHLFVSGIRKEAKTVRARNQYRLQKGDVDRVVVNHDQLIWAPLKTRAVNRDIVVHLARGYGQIEDVREALERYAAAGVQIVDEWGKPVRDFEAASGE